MRAFEPRRFFSAGREHGRELDEIAHVHLGVKRVQVKSSQVKSDVHLGVKRVQVKSDVHLGGSRGSKSSQVKSDGEHAEARMSKKVRK